ncbi:MAG TPA: lanthionine synthetase LanC family protein [Frankiaceae bacterium]|nr:lanthionine synthetase LanC family protein [Frankiaceae bacterium]
MGDEPRDVPPGRAVLDESALDVVREVAAALAPTGAAAGWGYSLARGTAGIALFLAETALALGDDALADTAAAHLDAAVDAAVAAPISTSLFSGTVGVGWVLSHLDGRLLDASDALGDVDELVLASIDAFPAVADLTDGLVGLGVYLLSRLPAAEAYDGLARIVRRLAATSEPDATWWRRPDTMPADELDRYPEGYLSLGMAHGQPGVVALLARLHAAGVEGAGELLRQATAALTAFASRDHDAFGRYPTVLAARDEDRHGSRLAWCYGDPGVATALLAAGRALADDAVVAEALETARAAAARPFDGSMVVDAGLCHGTAGLVQIFARLYGDTKDEVFADAARRWYGVLLGQRVAGGPYAGFQAILDAEVGYVPLPGLLEGAAGAGLALLDAALPAPLSWDGVLLTEGGAGAPPSV